MLDQELLIITASSDYLTKCLQESIVRIKIYASHSQSNSKKVWKHKHKVSKLSKSIVIIASANIYGYLLQTEIDLAFSSKQKVYSQIWSKIKAMLS